MEVYRVKGVIAHRGRSLISTIAFLAESGNGPNGSAYQRHANHNTSHPYRGRGRSIYAQCHTVSVLQLNSLLQVAFFSRQHTANYPLSLSSQGAHTRHAKALRSFPILVTT